MNVSLNWLAALLGRELEPRDIADRLAMLGAPVDAIEPVHQDLAEIVVARVEEVGKHPNADRLSLCRVDNGAEVVEVVCGAPNVEAGALYPYAPLGAVLPNGVKLKGKKIRGIVSNGMLCSASELGLGSDHDGILELDVVAPPGTRLLDALPLADTRLEIDVTPNRPDLLGHKGVARDLSVGLEAPVKLPDIPGSPPDAQAPVTVPDRGTVGGVKVSIDDAEGCPRYMAAVIEGVTVGPSPEWMAARLRAIGQRPINNVVDVTNYVLFELNQPLHAFDRATLAGPAIVIRRAAEKETLRTLDGEDRALTPDVTVIADADTPIALAGIMGGADSEVTDATTDVVLECAYFDPKRTRASRVGLGLSTDASYRFERGTDIDGMAEALRRAVRLIVAVAGGVEAGPPVDVYPKPRARPSIFLRPERVAHLLGVEVPQREIERYLTGLGFAVAPKDGRMAVQAPGWRPDVTREVDLIEEVARVRGYDSFPAAMRPLRPSTVPDDPREPMKARIRQFLVARGLHEARTSSLGPPGSDDAAGVINPLSNEESHLRVDLLAGLGRAVEHNWAVRERDVRLFEIGAVFRSCGAGRPPDERLRVAAVVTGARRPPHWSDSGKTVDFDRWDVKSLFEEVAALAGPDGEIDEVNGRWILRDERQNQCGWAGGLDLDRPAWAAPVLAFEVDVTPRGQTAVRYANLPTMPPLERDVALVLPPGVDAAQVEAVLRSVGGKLLETATPFDEYRGADLAGRSVAWRLVFRAPNRTLRDRDADGVVARMLKALKEQCGVERR